MSTDENNTEHCKCWICGSEDLTLARNSNVASAITSDSFAITDSTYGVTGTLYRCNSCNFRQCTDMNDVLSYYEELEDTGYEESRAPRSYQAEKLLGLIQRHHSNGHLLDIGAGSGILVEAAMKLGYKAEGIEPSRWLQKVAEDKQLPVHLGIFPNPNIRQSYDVITLIDVIEHIPNPVEILSGIADALATDGIGIVVTPDLDSFVAKLLGYKWWHFRLAHIGYFNRKTLLMALERSGLEPIEIGRPTWYFSGDYIVERANKYLPKWLKLPSLSLFKRATIPLNLRDSWYVIFQKKA